MYWGWYVLGALILVLLGAAWGMWLFNKAMMDVFRHW